MNRGTNEWFYFNVVEVADSDECILKDDDDEVDDDDDADEDDDYVDDYGDD